MSDRRDDVVQDAWSVLSETVLLDRAPYFKAIQETVRTDTGAIIEDFYRIVLGSFSVCVPLSEDGRFITLWQYKHGPKQYSLTFPAGFLDSGEAADVACRRELLEETGFEARDLLSLGRFVDNGNQETATGHYFLAIGCAFRQPPRPGDHETMRIRLMEAAEIDVALRSGQIVITHHVAAWLLASKVLQIC